MITDLGIIDTGEEVFTSLRLNPGHITELITTAAQVLAAAGAKREDVLSLYTPAPMLWEIPSVYSSDLLGTPLNLSLPNSKSLGPGALYAAYQEGAKLVARKGFGDAALGRMVELFGSAVEHPLCFTHTEPSKEAVAVFGMEWASLLSPLAKESTFQADHAFVRLATEFFTPRMGLIGGACEGSTKVTEEFVTEHLTSPRGFINFGTFDAIDRANLWVVQNYFSLEEPSKVLRALSLLKLTQDLRVAHRFEQALHKLPQVAALSPSLKMLAYNDESLNAIRDIWYDHTKDSKEKLNLLHLQLVPVYLDDGQFYDMFKHVPSKIVRFSFKMEQDISRGLDKFVTLFLQTRRAIAEGKRVVMDE